jgi:hypothetical protein
MTSAAPLIVQTVAIVLSAIGVIASITWSRIVSRRRATIDMILAEQTNKELLQIRSEYLDALRENRLLQYANLETWFTPQAFPLVSILNRYEITAIGIAEGIIDEKIYRRYWRTSLVRDWLGCQPVVVHQREVFGNPKLFCDFEALAKRWATADELREISN